jgi:hypothetical protein
MSDEEKAEMARLNNEIQKLRKLLWICHRRDLYSSCHDYVDIEDDKMYCKIHLIDFEVDDVDLMAQKLGIKKKL